MERSSDAAAANAIPAQSVQSEPFVIAGTMVAAAPEPPLGQSFGVRDGSATRTQVGEGTRA